MTTPIESTRRASTHSASGLRQRSALISGLVFAAFAAILLGTATSGEWAAVLASLAGFTTAITVVAAAVISWEHVVVNAQSAGLVESATEQRWPAS